LLWLFWRWGISNYLPGLASNLSPPNLSLLSSYDYRLEPLVPGLITRTWALIRNVSLTPELHRHSLMSYSRTCNFSSCI
jgi:hypothetical protein